jgi:hypothetical protein
MVSPGPNRWEDFLPQYMAYTQGSLCYDPSNGTVSVGDIIYAGGGGTFRN